MNTEKLKGDKIIWIIAILLSVFSLLVVYSSTGSLAQRKRDGFNEFFLIRQLIFVILGIAIMYTTYRIRFTYFSRIAQVLFYLSLPLMFYMALFGPVINEARRTLIVPGTDLTFQPGDLAKLALIMFIARFLAHKKDDIQDFKKGFLPILLWILLMCSLFIRGGLTTTAIVFSTSFIMLYMGGAKFKHLLSLVGIGIAALALFLAVEAISGESLSRKNTWKSRIDEFINPPNDPGSQVVLSKIAVASGGLFGKMPGNSTQRNFLQHPYSDYVFAIIIEEYGIVGGTTIVFIYLILLFRSLKIARRCDKLFGSFLVIGISFMLVFQAMINMGVVVNLLPVTGQTLPLISMGGTSFWFTCIGIGMILSVSRSVSESQNTIENINYAPATA